MLGSFTKDPNGVREITIDFADFLGTKTISAATWIIPAVGDLVKESESNTTTTSSVILSAGRLNAEVKSVCRITFGPSSPAEKTDRTILVVMKAK